MTKPSLHDVTICAADCLNPALAAAAIERSMAHCEFGDAILFSSVPADTAIRQVRIAPMQSRRDYSRFVLKRLHEFIETPFVLIVQWDGFVLDGTCWRDEFLQWDYIGAVWEPTDHCPTMEVGNGGFSLRSRRLLDAVARLPIRDDEDELEDGLICRGYRRWLELERHIRFAPTALAHQFSFEELPTGQPTLGFHGAFNLDRVLGEKGALEWVQRADPRTWGSEAYLNWAMRCLVKRRVYLGARLFALAIDAHGENRVRRYFEKCMRDRQGVDAMMGVVRVAVGNLQALSTATTMATQNA